MRAISALKNPLPAKPGPAVLAVWLLALAAPLLIAASEPALESLEIIPGVYARGRSLGTDRAAVEAVWIRPMRSAGQPSPDLAPLLEAAYNWCAGNRPNGFRDSEKGMASLPGCPIRVESGVYRITRTAVLRQHRWRVPIDIDLGSSTILHMPDDPRSVRVADLKSLSCDPQHLGDYYNVIDAENFDDFTHADPDGDVPIRSIAPNSGRTKGCPRGPVCRYGGNAVRVTTAKPHGFIDGGALQLGDVAVFQVPNTPYQGQRLLVKEVVSPTEFIVTPFFAPVPAQGGSVRETATTVWCNGHRWRAGKPMISIGGPGDTRSQRVALHGGKFSVDGSLFRTAAVLVDGDSGPDSRGGAEWVSVDTMNEGNGELRGQIVVDMGVNSMTQNLCQHIEVRVLSDAWGPSWGPAVWNRTCGLSEISLRQGHGGGIWIGLDEPGYTGPTPVTVSGAILGCRDGPCLWMRSGTLNFAPGVLVAGSQVGPLATPPGPNRGLIAILGGRPGTRVNVIAHGVSWSAGQDADLDCHIMLGDVAVFVQQGGALTAGNASLGTGEDTLFCQVPGSEVDEFVLEHTRNLSWGGKPRFVDVGKQRR